MFVVSTKTFVEWNPAIAPQIASKQSWANVFRRDLRSFNRKTLKDELFLARRTHPFPSLHESARVRKAVVFHGPGNETNLPGCSSSVANIGCSQLFEAALDGGLGGPLPRSLGATLNLSCETRRNHDMTNHESISGLCFTERQTNEVRHLRSARVIGRGREGSPSAHRNVPNKSRPNEGTANTSVGTCLRKDWQLRQSQVTYENRLLWCQARPPLR
jgi:hypothetical protein